jgi:CelD/BcsL family acetyltransferase involved in cellulose biosynthesis
MPCGCDKIEVEEIGSLEALDRIAVEWEELWRSDPRATPFQTPAWLIPWWRHIGVGELMTIAVRAGGELVGLAPLYIYDERGERRVFPLGVATSDYLDALAHPHSRTEVVIAVWRHLDEQRGRWDECEMPQLRAGALLLEGALPRQWQDEVGQCEPCPTVDLAAPLPHSLAQNIRYYRRRAEKMGPVRLECGEAMFAELIRLHGARWSAKARPGVLADEQVRRWHAEAMPMLEKMGLLRMYGLTIGERVVAALYGLIDRADGENRRFYYYLGGFDPELDRISPGTLVIAAAMEEARREGCAIFDFLRGSEPYKYLWGARDMPAYRRRLRHATELPTRPQEALCERC